MVYNRAVGTRYCPTIALTSAPVQLFQYADFETPA